VLLTKNALLTKVDLNKGVAQNLNLQEQITVS